jgi:hypothetical protein
VLTLFGISTNAVQLGGLAGFALSAAACGWAAAHGHRAWRKVAWLQLACWAEVLISVRHHLHGAAVGILRQFALYESRHNLQVALLGALALCAALASVWAWNELRKLVETNALIGVAVAASGFSILVFLTEVISLHSIDAWMYAPLGPFNVISLLWAAGALTVSVCALIAARR